MIYAMKQKAYYDRIGVRARICHGYYKGERHTWVEYLHNGTWLVDDEAIGIKGWTREECRHYEFSWCGEVSAK
ncbi:MAG: hypothetical protein M0P69_01540 [Bacteroidales bacterium]|nr:hypothetical protein [Bacteroidales bacterium]